MKADAAAYGNSAADLIYALAFSTWKLWKPSARRRQRQSISWPTQFRLERPPPSGHVSLSFLLRFPLAPHFVARSRLGFHYIAAEAGCWNCWGSWAHSQHTHTAIATHAHTHTAIRTHSPKLLSSSSNQRRHHEAKRDAAWQQRQGNCHGYRTRCVAATFFNGHSEGSWERKGGSEEGRTL